MRFLWVWELINFRFSRNGCLECRVALTFLPLNRFVRYDLILSAEIDNRLPSVKATDIRQFAVDPATLYPTSPVRTIAVLSISYCTWTKRPQFSIPLSPPYQVYNLMFLLVAICQRCDDSINKVVYFFSGFWHLCLLLSQCSCLFLFVP